MGIEARKPLNVSLEASLVVEARELGVNLSRAAETGIRKAVQSAKAEQWQRENAAAIDAYNAWMEVNELPLRQYRDF
jgi:antitoxin CcdA